MEPFSNKKKVSVFFAIISVMVFILGIGTATVNGADHSSIVNRKATFDFRILPKAKIANDWAEIVAFLELTPDFVLPFGEDVTVDLRLQDPNDPSSTVRVFRQTIPAGTINQYPDSTYYRYTGRGTGIWDFVLNPVETSTGDVYMYLYVNKADFLPDDREVLTEDAYRDLVRTVGEFKVRVIIGENVWAGSAPLEPKKAVPDYTKNTERLIYIGF
jgi:hypothetical protein